MKKLLLRLSYLAIVAVFSLQVSFAIGATVTKGLIGEEDQSKWNGVSSTFTRATSTGGTITLNKIGYEVDALMVYGGGVNYTKATIAAALTAIGATNKVTLVLRPGTWTITDDLTITANITLKIPAGATMQISTAKTLTVNGPLDAGLYQIFSCVGTGKVVLGSGAVKEALPEWWGIDGTSDQTEINAAIYAVSAFHGIVRLQAKSYVIDGQILAYTGTNLLGSGIDVATGTLSTSISSSYNGYAIAVASTSAESTAIRIKDVKILLDATGHTSIAGVDMNCMSNSDLENVIVQMTGGNSTGAGFQIKRTGSYGGNYNRMVRCTSIAAAGTQFGYGLYMTGDTNYNVIDHFRTVRGDTNVNLSGAHNMVSNLVSESTVSFHIMITNGSGYGNHIILAPYMNGATAATCIYNAAVTNASTVIAPTYADYTTLVTGGQHLNIISGSVKPRGLSPTYGTTIAAFDAMTAESAMITVTDNVAFTISNPTNPVVGARLTVVIFNNSGGAMGTITWDTAFALGGAFNNPANGKYRLITFRYFGSKWLEESRTAADI